VSSLHPLAANPPSRYLAWAIAEFPRARWDLASSGVAPVPPSELGMPDDLADPRAVERFTALVAKRYGVPTSEVVPALGGAGGLAIVAQAMFRPGDEVLVEAPAYEPVYRVVEARGAVVSRFARAQEDGYRFDTSRVLALLTPRTRAVIVTNPHNPSGIRVDDAELAELAAALGVRGVELVVDEVYLELCAPAKTARRLAPNVCAVSSLTKCFGLGWARAGWALMRPELCEEARVATMHTCGVLPTTVGAIGARALGSIDRLAQRVRDRSAGKREKVDAFLARHRSRLRWAPPPAEMQFGFVHDVRGQDLTSAVQAGLEAEGVIVVPGAFFDLPSAFRMSWTLSADKLDEALVRLARALGLAAS